VKSENTKIKSNRLQAMNEIDALKNLVQVSDDLLKVTLSFQFSVPERRTSAGTFADLLEWFHYCVSLYVVMILLDAQKNRPVVDIVFEFNFVFVCSMCVHLCSI
jgi:uncharacterized membrane protein YbhN (UPF0104 family)